MSANSATGMSCPAAVGCACEGKGLWSSTGVRRILAYREPIDIRKSFTGLQHFSFE